jgi:hypothetical protein
MATIFIEIGESLLLGALLSSQGRGITLDIFIDEALNAALVPASSNPMSAQKETTVDDMIASALDCVRSKEVGSEFMLEDLCPDDDWQTLSTGNRKSLGKKFRKAVVEMKEPIAEYVRRTSSNKAVYKKI